MIPRSDWRWFGMPGHFIGSEECCFHMVTVIGDVKVSTIGCYHPARKPKDYSHRTPIGAGDESLYETYVFALSDGHANDAHPFTVQPGIIPQEIDSERYASEPEAEAGHMRFCEKWAALDGDPKAAA